MSNVCLTSECNNYLSGPIGQLFTSSLQVLLAAQCLIDEKWPPDATNNVTDFNYDYIVVGGGSAGCVVAARLSEDSCRRVLLIEAGGDPPMESLVPGGFQFNFNSPYNWNYTTEGEMYACLASNGICAISAGKILGGGSSINGMYHVRGNRQDYDDIAAAGNDGWDYETVLKYFTKSENMTIDDIKKNPALAMFHNFDGPVGVSDVGRNSHIIETIVKAYEEAGYPDNPDYNGKSQNGVVHRQTSVIFGKRSSTARRYLAPAHDRPNLVVFKNAFATKLLINQKVATGVRVLLSNGFEIEVSASKEVIVCAGAIRTPQLLMLSGIGPKEHLNELNISVIADLAVGQNLIDHNSFMVSANITGILPYHHESEYPLDVANYLAFRKGFFVDNYNPTVKTDSFIPVGNNDNAPSLKVDHLITTASMMKPIGWFPKHEDLEHEAYLESTIIFLLQLLDPYSRGVIMLSSTNPTDYPIIRGNYLEDPRDVEKLLAGIELVKTILRTKSFQSYKPKLLRSPSPVCDSIEFDTEPYWRCIVAQFTRSNFHVLGTAKMGPASDENAVVNPQLQVYGIKKLRVVDGSVIPSNIRGNTNIPIIMFAERTSDLIKESHMNE